MRYDKVYLVARWNEDGDAYRVECVCSTKEQAKEYILCNIGFELESDNKIISDYSIEEMMVERG